MNLSARQLQTELLDVLPAADPRAQRSRRELVLVNRLMGQRHILLRALREVERNLGRPPRTIVELGAGDGAFMCLLARSLSRHWREVEIVLADRQALVRPDTLLGYAAYGWRARTLTVDLLRPDLAAVLPAVEVIVANLVLHHFEDTALRGLLTGVADRCEAFVATEPRRSVPGLAASKALPLIGCGPVSRHDAEASVRAGFRDHELSQLWPGTADWRLREQPAGLFTHLFIAQRVPAGSSTLQP